MASFFINDLTLIQRPIASTKVLEAVDKQALEAVCSITYGDASPLTIHVGPDHLTLTPKQLGGLFSLLINPIIQTLMSRPLDYTYADKPDCDCLVCECEPSCYWFETNEQGERVAFFIDPDTTDTDWRPFAIISDPRHTDDIEIDLMYLLSIVEPLLALAYQPQTLDVLKRWQAANNTDNQAIAQRVEYREARNAERSAQKARRAALEQELDARHVA